MSERITRFLADLSKDPQKVEELWENPEAFLTGAELTEEEKELVRSGDAERLRKAMGYPLFFGSISTSTTPPPGQPPGPPPGPPPPDPAPPPPPPPEKPKGY